MATLENAICLAQVLHADQRDKAGRPYIGHVLRVIDYTRLAGGDIEAQTVAALHDIIEDTGYLGYHLRLAGFSEHIVQTVVTLSRRQGEDYMDYIRRVASDPLARIVKLADLQDHLEPRRLELLDKATQERLSKKYAPAVALLSFR